MKTLFAIIALLPACTTIHEYVEDWPKLDTQVHVVPAGEIFARCYQYAPVWQKLLGGVPLACAEIFFSKGECHVWVAENTTPETLEHEVEHCRGGDHDSLLQDALTAYRGGSKLPHGADARGIPYWAPLPEAP